MSRRKANPADPRQGDFGFFLEPSTAVPAPEAPAEDFDLALREAVAATLDDASRRNVAPLRREAVAGRPTGGAIEQSAQTGRTDGDDGLHDGSLHSRMLVMTLAAGRRRLRPNTARSRRRMAIQPLPRALAMAARACSRAARWATESTALFEQQAGRVSRPVWPAGFDPNAVGAEQRRAAMATAGKGRAGILDMVGNWTRHGLPGADRPWTLAGGIKGQERMVTPVRRCRRCYRVHEWADECPACWFRYPADTTGALKALARVPGVGEYTAEEIKLMPFDRVQVMVARASDADARTIAKIRGYDRQWLDKVRAAGGAR